MAVAAGTRLGPYQIVGPLGAGGMGEVYRARDTRLGRDVALKVLRAEVVGDPERVKRFEKEARTVASLSHPNILALYDVGTHEGAPYLVTELLEGQTLAERIRAGDLTLAKAVELGTQIAHGLAAAHEHRVVHRDLKPGNVFVTKDGVVKILDFGLARLTRPEDGDWDPTSASTETGPTEARAMLGTVGYMAPEQVRGLPADHRADVFSFGCVLYEMLAGERAFRGHSASDVVAAILKEDPAPLPASVPPALDRIMRRCLEKRPEDRFQSTHDLALALGTIGGVAGPVHGVVPSRRALALTGAAVLVLLVGAFVWKGIPALQNSSPRPGTPMTLAGPKPRIVVLPFENTSPEPDTEFYADGITTEITEKLSKVKALTVLSHRTALALKGTPKTVPGIAAELNLRYVLEGTIRRAGKSLRINVRLIDGTSEAILWSGQFPGTLDDVFDMQEKVARGIVEGLALKLSSAEDREIAGRRITNAQAYDCYLSARNDVILFTPEGTNAALQRLQKCRQLSGANALFDAGLGYAYWQLGNLGLQQDEAFAKAEEYAEQALRLDPDSAEAYMVLGLVQQLFHGNVQQSVRDYKRALSIDPDNVDALYWLSITYSWVGRTSAAMALADRLKEINPLDATFFSARMWADYMDGRFDLSAESQKEAIGLADVPLYRVVLAYALAAAGRFEAALAALEPIGPIDSPDYGVRLGHFLRLALRGDTDGTSKLLDPEFVATMRRDFVYSFMVADCFAILDEREQALGWLENAARRGFINYPYLSEHDPFVAKLRNEPRFQKLMVRVKREWESFEE